MTDLKKTIEEISALSKAACGNGEVSVSYNDAPDEVNVRWYIDAGNTSVATNFPTFKGKGDSLEEALSAIRKDIKTHP
jgi:hypothetical protein